MRSLAGEKKPLPRTPRTEWRHLPLALATSHISHMAERTATSLPHATWFSTADNPLFGAPANLDRCIAVLKYQRPSRKGPIREEWRVQVVKPDAPRFEKHSPSDLVGGIMGRFPTRYYRQEGMQVARSAIQPP